MKTKMQNILIAGVLLSGLCVAGAADKNHLAARHTHNVINPFLKSLRGKVPLVLFSLPGDEDPIRKKLYRSFRGRPSEVIDYV